ncbi:DUF1937 family protein [Marinobacter nauticus]|uniref:DUF1937 family protein n=1 Tax=Marinobacter nauticus TaxID=2743 RepID=UPI000F19AE5E|nr:DUF1937 family protein [Marinobacter nauticus]RKR79191.1 uncharacterized protein DUF4406 [Marinobacter nauticus]
MSEVETVNLGGECGYCGLLSPVHKASCPVAKVVLDGEVNTNGSRSIKVTMPPIKWPSSEDIARCFEPLNDYLNGRPPTVNDEPEGASDQTTEPTEAGGTPEYERLIEGILGRNPSLAAAIAEPGVPYHELICGHPEPEKKQGMKLVYVAGPYRAETREGVAQNVAAARHVGRLCVQKGWFPVLPTVNTAHLDHDFPGLADDQYWLDGTMEMMRRCDAVVLVDGWQYSSGAKAEIEEARKMGLKVYMSSHVLPELAKVNA